MKKIAKLIPLFLALTMMISGAWALAEGDIQEVDQAPLYPSFTGIVTEIRFGTQGAGAEKGFAAYLQIKNDENPDGIVFTMDESSYLQDGVFYGVGDEITAFIDGNAPAVLIYPPRYAALALVRVEEGGLNLKVDRFDGNGQSADGTLALNLAEDTRVIAVDGTPYEGDLPGKLLAVYYGATTRSIPAQTTPELIVVLD